MSTATSPSIEHAARILVEARRERRVLTELPAELRPQSSEAGYEIQRAVRDLWCETTGDTVAGWKIGATADAVQAKFGVTEPFAGPFFASTVLQSPARLNAADYHHRVIESEFAFRFGRALAPRVAAYTRADVIAAVSALVPAIEIISPRFADLLFGRAPTAIADCALNAAFVFGVPCTAWADLDLPAYPVTLRVNGAIAAQGTGAAVLGDPIAVLVWAVNHLSRQGITVEPGQMISTGTTTGIVTLAIGDKAVADFGALGTVAVQFA